VNKKGFNLKYEILIHFVIKNGGEGGTCTHLIFLRYFDILKGFYSVLTELLTTFNSFGIAANAML